MELGTQFKKAAEDVMKLSARPSNDTLLALYALFKQATEGDASGKRPGLMDLKGRKKYDAWAEKKGMSKENAMQEYVALVNSLQH
ncbi:MAG: acyl-CoA-binding protein [Bdellovibrionales bacterium]|nr:acyl-CoA-binding protein [Bdellovibrionales bacterium]